MTWSWSKSLINLELAPSSPWQPRPAHRIWALSNLERLPVDYGPDCTAWTNSFALCVCLKDENITDVREWVACHRCEPCWRRCSVRRRHASARAAWPCRRSPAFSAHCQPLTALVP